MALNQTKPATNKRKNPDWTWEQFVKLFLEQASNSIKPTTKMRLMTMLKSTKLGSIPSWVNYTNTESELSHFLNNLNIDCESDKSKVDNFKSLSALIFDNIVQAQLFDDRILKDEKLGLNILKKINSITGDKISLDEEPKNFSEGVQRLVANIIYPLLDKSTNDQNTESDPQSEINNVSEEKQLSKISSKPKPSWLEKLSTDNAFNNNSEIFSENKYNTSQKKKRIRNEKKKKKSGKRKSKEKKSKEKKSQTKKPNKLHTQNVSKKKIEPFSKNLQSISDPSLLGKPIISDVHQDISEEKQVSKISFKPKPSWLDKSSSDFYNNSPQAHADKSNKPNEKNKNEQLLDDLNEKDVPLNKKVLPKLKFDIPKAGKLKPSNLQNDPAKNNLTMDKYDEGNVTDNNKNGVISDVDNRNKNLNSSGSIHNNTIIDINKTDSRPTNGKRKKVIYSGKLMNKLMKFKLKESSSISRKGKLVSKIKVSPEKLKRSKPIPGKGKLVSKSKVVSNKTGKKKPSVKKTKIIEKLPIVSKNKYYFDDETVREIRRPADEVLLKSVSHTILENNNEFNSKPMQQSYSTNENKNNDLGQNYMEDKTDINKNLYFYDKENNKKLSVAVNDNETKRIGQNFRGDKVIVNKNIPVEYQKHNERTNRVLDNNKVDTEPNSMDRTPNINEYKTVYDKDMNKLTNKVQDTNLMNTGQNIIDEKKNVFENNTVYDEDYNSITNTNIEQVNKIKNVIPSLIDENKDVKDKITSSDKYYNKLSNKDKDKMNIEQKPMDEKKNVNEYSTVRDKDYNILTDTDRNNDKKVIIMNFIDENKNVNEKITSFDKEYNSLTNKAHEIDKNNRKKTPIDKKMNVNEYKTVHGKDYNKFTDTAESKNKTDEEQKLVDKKTKTIEKNNVTQNLIDENTSINEKITNFDKENNKLTYIAQDKDKKNIEQKHIDFKNNADENNTIHENDYNKLTNMPQDNNKTDKEQKLRDEKTIINEYKTVYDKDYKTLTNTDRYNDIKNTSNFRDKNMNVNEKNTNLNNDYNKLTNKAQDNDKKFDGQKHMDEKTNVNEYSTVRVKDYNTLTKTDRFYDKNNIITNYLDENMNVNDQIINVDNDYNELTNNKFQGKDKNNVGQKPIDEKMNVNEPVYDKDYNTLTNTDRYNDKINIRTNYLDENSNVNEKNSNFNKDYNKLTNKAQDKGTNYIEKKPLDERTNVNGYKTVCDKDYNTLTNIDRYNDKLNIRTNYLDKGKNINEKKTIYDKGINNIYDKNCNKYRYNNNMRTDEHGRPPLKPLSPIRVVDRKIINNRKTATCKPDNTKIMQLDSDKSNNTSNKSSRTSENRKTKCNEVRKKFRFNKTNNEILDKIEEKFKSRILDDKIFWEKWIKRASMDCIKSFKPTRPKEGSKYRYATDETKMKTLMEHEEVRNNHGIIYQIRKKDDSDFSLCKAALPLYEIRVSTNDKYSDYCNDIRLSKLCGNIHPIITGPPIENDSKLSEKLEDLGSWEHNFNKCICQNKLTKMCSVDDKLLKPKYSSCKKRKKMF